MTTSNATLDRNRRVIAVANVKGGVGKTSITANLAGELAAAGYKVLVVDLDPQGNLRNSLGYRDTAADDQGAQLLHAVSTGAPFAPSKDIRAGLDVIGGGIRAKELQHSLLLAAMSGRSSTSQFAEVLSLTAPSYDIVLLDTPPSPGMLQASALVAARYVLLPVEGDDDSYDGLAIMKDEIDEVRDRNPVIQALGVVRFRMAKSATRTREEARLAVEQMLGESVAFDAVIRDAYTVARIGKQEGQLARELGSNPRAAAFVAEDYRQLASEVLTVIAGAEKLHAEHEDVAR